MRSFFSSTSSSIRQAGTSRAQQKGMYRFFNNEKVSEEDLVSACLERTESVSKGRHVLVLNDTSEINLDSHSGRLQPESGIGLVGNNKNVGFFTHLGLVVDIETYQAIGYSSIHFWNRSMDPGQNKFIRGYKNMPVEEKESYKWLRCITESRKVLQDAASITVVGDRESDMYELFVEARTTQTHVVARNRGNRKLAENSTMYESLESTAIAGSYELDLLGDVRKSTKNRTATLKVKFKKVTLRKPEGKRDGRPSEIDVWVVETKENKDKGICWRLLTTHEIKNFEDAVQVIEWYAARWFIEEVFRLLKKKGYRVEDSQLESGWAIRKLTIVLLHTILRVMQMLIAYGSTEEQDAGLAFGNEEIDCLKRVNIKYQGRTEKLNNPHKESTLNWATWIIARVGGWSGYHSQRPPGPITLKNGIDKFNSIFQGWMMAKDVGTQ